MEIEYVNPLFNRCENGMPQKGQYLTVNTEYTPNLHIVPIL